jgi:hypothetical protein
MSNWSEYEKLGQQWLKGEIQIVEWQGKKLNKKQIEFVNSKERFPLLSGGLGSGKTFAFCVKINMLALFFPNNLILLGRKSRTQVEKTTLNDLFDASPPGSYEYKVGPGVVQYGNGSQVVIFGLEGSASGSDILGAIQAIKGMNLGAFFIDQMEEVVFDVYEALTSRLRRKMTLSDGTIVDFQQGNATANPANYWAFDWYKIHPRPNTHLIETSMLDNKEHLPKAYIEDQLSKPRLWVQKYVYGEWSTEFLSENTVFSQEYITEQLAYQKEPIRTFDNIKFYAEPNKDHTYQVGVDPSEGANDPCAIVVVDKDTGEVVATYNELVPTEKQTDTAAYLAYLYNKALVVPESTGVGAAFIQDFKKKYPRIYTRKTTGRYDDKETNKLGFSTNHSSKVMLIENLKELFNKHFPKVYDKKIISELQVFVYSDEARQKGAGAQAGFHDDLLMATMLAFYEVKASATPLAEEMEKTMKEWSKHKLYGQNYR